MRTISLMEHEGTTISNLPDENQLTVTEAEALDRTQRFIGVEAFRWTGRSSLKATHHVGMLAARQIRLEILPKIEGLGLGETRHTLMRMIAAAWGIPIHDGDITGHDCQDRDLLELLIILFARRLSAEVRKGLSRTYRRRENDLRKLRGKLAVTRQFSTLAASPQKIACQYEEFTADSALNRLLLCALTYMRRHSTRASTQRLLNEISGHFEDVEDLTAHEALQEKILIDRANHRWESLERLARSLLSALYQTTHGGSADGIALLFDMNSLYEAFIAAATKKALIPLGYNVHTQSPLLCLARSRTGDAAFRTKPDIYVERDGRVTIIDTKWKRIDLMRSNFDVAQSDAYQMHGYAHIYRAQSTILLYPHHGAIATSPGLQTLWHFESGGGALKLATIDITKTEEVGTELHRLLEPN